MNINNVINELKEYCNKITLENDILRQLTPYKTQIQGIILLYTLTHPLKNNFYIMDLNDAEKKYKDPITPQLGLIGRLETTSSGDYMLMFEHPQNKGLQIIGYIEKEEIKTENIKVIIN